MPNGLARVIRVRCRRCTPMATVGDTLRDYFREQGLPEGGGVDLAWVHFKIGPIPLAFPNIPARREAVLYHDVHHLVTGYQTDWPGEAEIGSWEVASGCGRYWVAWLLNSSAIGFGLLLCPRRSYRAFLRGRHSRNLYREAYEPVLLEDIDALRKRLGLEQATPRATFLDVMAYLFWAAIGLAWMLLLPAALWLVFR